MSRISVDLNLLYTRTVDLRPVKIAFDVSRPEKKKRLNHASWSTAFHSKNFCKILSYSQNFQHLVKLNPYQYKLLKVFEAKF